MPTLSQSSYIRYLFFFILYFAQGIPAGFALTTILNYFTAQGLDTKAIATFGAVVGIPWGLKFLWGPIIDRFQKSSMGRRRPWIIFSQISVFLVSLSMLLIKNPVISYDSVMIGFLIISIFMCLQDISTDALAIALVPSAERGRLNAFMKAGSITGQALGGIGLSFLLHHSGFQVAVLAQTIIILITIILALFVKEHSKDRLFSFYKSSVYDNSVVERSFISLLLEVGRAIIRPQSLFLFGAIGVTFMCIRVFKRVYSVHLIQKLGWSDINLSVFTGTYNIIITLCLAFAGGFILDRIGIKKTLSAVTILITIFYLCFSMSENYWDIKNVASMGLVIQQTLETILVIVSFTVIMSICKSGIEGTQFAIYMAIISQADTLGTYLSGILYPKYNVSFIGITCGLMVLSATIVIALSFRKKQIVF